MQKPVILVENDLEISDGIKFVLDDMFESDVLAKVTSKADICKDYKSSNPDLTIISLDPDNKHDVKYAKSFMEKYPDAKAVALSSSQEPIYHNFVRKMGFLGYIDKSNFKEEYKTCLGILSS